MTSLPEPRPGQKKLGLVIDLDICVGCHACATACKEWNTGGHMAPLPDFNPYGAGAWGVWFNRIHAFEEGEGEGARTVHFPRSCLHCEEPACVTVCPTGASYKRAEDGIVLVDETICIGCKLCSWACPYGAREFDDDAGVMKKCTLVHRPHLQRAPPAGGSPARPASWSVRSTPGISAISATRTRQSRSWWRERGGADLMPELGYKPVNKYLPPRRERMARLPAADEAPAAMPVPPGERLLRWVDRLLSR